MSQLVKIAIIEDDPIIAQMYRMKFESEGFLVDVADNGKNGIDLVEHTSPDMILLDIQMPEMDGAEALQRIRKLPRCDHTPVIVLTNLGEEEAPSDLKSLGISGYIVKADMTPRQVVKQVKDTLAV